MSQNKRASWVFAVVFAIGGFAVGCGDATEPSSTPAPPKAETPAPAPPPPSPPAVPDTVKTPDENPKPTGTAVADAKAGLADYQIFCASCHGATGGGDGPVAVTLPVQPAKHSDGGYMNALTDEYLFKVISEGGSAVGKSEMMAPWSGSLSDAQIHNIIAFIRSLADPPYTQ